MLRFLRRNQGILRRLTIIAEPVVKQENGQIARQVAHWRSALCLLWSAAAVWAALSTNSHSAEKAEPVPATFEPFLRELWPDAQARSISRGTFDHAFAGIAPDARVIAATQHQPEYGRPVGAYINSVASEQRVTVGQRKAAQWLETLGAVENRFAIDRWTIMAIWGIETSFGEVKDKWDIIRSLATLAQAGYRHPYFRNELLVALSLLQDGSIPRHELYGSWAGAMGQPQFMPSNFADYAVDFSGDGRRDIWNNVPDVLASIANYLHKEGWNAALPLGFEVTLPADFDYRRPSRASFAQWTELGLRRPDGHKFLAQGEGILFFPSGAAGPAFLATTNFDVVKRYNNSDVYALAVLHLADRIHGLPPISARWPADDVQLSRAQRIALQSKLAELGYPVHDFEGHFDFEVRDFIRAEQMKAGIIPDGHPTPALLDRLGIH
jgi:lytic murein transglycosylase